MRTDHRVLTRRKNTVDGVRRGMRHVDQHAKLIHFFYDVLAECGESLVTRRFGHDVAQLVDSIVHQLQHAHAEIIEKFDPRQIPSRGSLPSIARTAQGWRFFLASAISVGDMAKPIFPALEAFSTLSS